ncbi:MAG: radical SAM protein [Candidatus Rokuibacteriota bacterium]
MSVELRPLGVKCNIQCQYCYQNPQRDAGNVLQTYDLARMKAATEAAGGGFTLFGGEPLMVPEKDLEDLWAWGLQKYGFNGIQTNGTLINDTHLRLFRQYRVHVGISVDGPGELNDVRWVGTLEATREATDRTHAAIERLCREGLPPSLIITLHRCNATRDKLPRMHDWLHYLESIGITSARLHVLEVESDPVRRKYALTTEENLQAFLGFLALEKELTTLRLDLFTDMRNLLLGTDNSTTCVWNACDPYTTRAVQGVEGNGQRSNCGRTNKDGIDFTKAGSEGFERYLALYHTPQEHGGCKGCRFFLMCKGQCPGTSIDGDWRNRTEHCDLWKQLYRRLEEEMLEAGLSPLSARPERKQVEQLLLETWAAGRNANIAGVLRQMSASPPAATGAQPTGSAHGDHTDRSLVAREASNGA